MYVFYLKLKNQVSLIKANLYHNAMLYLGNLFISVRLATVPPKKTEVFKDRLVPAPCSTPIEPRCSAPICMPHCQWPRDVRVAAAVAVAAAADLTTCC